MEYKDYLKELKFIKRCIDECNDSNLKIRLIEDYNRLKCHLDVFKENKYRSILIPNVKNKDYDNCKLCEKKNYYKTYDNIKDSLVFVNHLAFDIYSKYDFSKRDVFDLDTSDVIDVISNINFNTKRVFELVKDRVIINKDYGYSDGYGHCINLKNGIKPSIFIRDNENSCLNNYVFAHEFGHIYDYLINSNNKLMVNGNFFSECMSILFEVLFIKLVDEMDNKAGSMLVNFSQISRKRIVNSLECVKLYKEIIGNVFFDSDDYFYFDGYFASRNKDLINLLKESGNPSLIKYHYLLGILLGVSFVYNYSDYEKMLIDFNKVIHSNDFNYILSFIDYNSLNRFLGKGNSYIKRI